MASYNPANWYWIVAGSTTEVWSSAGVAYVPVTDATYVAWLAAGNPPTRIDSEASLADVFAQQYPAGWPQTLAQQAATAILAGYSVTSPTMPAINGTYACDPTAQGRFDSMYNLIQRAGGAAFPGGLTSLPWADIDGAVHVFTTVAEFLALETAIGDYVLELELIVTTNSGSLPAASLVLP